MQEAIWEAIIHCDAAYDGVFFYGVTTTGIFCRPSCKSKNPKQAHVNIFSTIDEAMLAGFRPCKRCRPDHRRLPDEDLEHHVVQFIEQSFQEPLTLLIIAGEQHVSPYHLHRTFKRVTGYTPADYVKKTRLNAAKKLLTEGRNTISEIALIVGFQNAAHFSTVFQKQFGMAPSRFRLREVNNETYAH